MFDENGQSRSSMILFPRSNPTSVSAIAKIKIIDFNFRFLARGPAVSPQSADLLDKESEGQSLCLGSGQHIKR